MVVFLPIQELPNIIFGCFSSNARITKHNLWLFFFQCKNYQTKHLVVFLPMQELPNIIFGCFFFQYKNYQPEYLAVFLLVQELPTESLVVFLPVQELLNRIFGCGFLNRIFGCFTASTRIFKQNLWLFNCQYKNYKTDFCFQSVEN